MLFWYFYPIHLMFKIEENGDNSCLKKEWEIGIDSKSVSLEVTSTLSHPSPFQVVGLIPECQTFEIPLRSTKQCRVKCYLWTFLKASFTDFRDFKSNDYSTICSFLFHRKKEFKRNHFEKSFFS